MNGEFESAKILTMPWELDVRTIPVPQQEVFKVPFTRVFNKNTCYNIGCTLDACTLYFQMKHTGVKFFTRLPKCPKTI